MEHTTFRYYFCLCFVIMATLKGLLRIACPSFIGVPTVIETIFEVSPRSHNSG
jgi:hypothetical protein